MHIKSIAGAMGLTAVGVILSCGPSQIYGVVKGTIDLIIYGSLRIKISSLEKKLKKLEKEGGQPREIAHMKTQIAGLKFDKVSRTISLKKDLTSLIPLVGAIAASYVGRKKSGFKLLSPNVKGVTKATAELLKDSSVKGVFYPMSGQSKSEYEDEQQAVTQNTYVDYIASAKTTLCAEEVKIPIQVRKTAEGKPQELDALFLPAYRQRNYDPSNKTVVIFHGNGMIGQDMLQMGDLYQSKGYNVLIPTMGGYPGSEGIETCEESTYQDVEGIKQLLEKVGVKEAGYHGTSIGGSLAFQAAVGESDTKIKTLFVVADQTFTSGKKAGERFARNLKSPFAPFGRGMGKAAFVKGRPFQISETLEGITDGLDNEGKARLMKEAGIPLIVIKSERDSIMGTKRGVKEDGGQYFQENFADELIKARYSEEGEDEVRKGRTITLKGGHCDSFTREGNEDSHQRFLSLVDELR